MTAKEAEQMKAEAQKLTLGKWYVGLLNGKTEEVMLMKDVMEIIDKHTASPTGAESEEVDVIIDKTVKEIFAQCKQTNPNYSKDWNEGFNDGMFHTITIIKGIRKEDDVKKIIDKYKVETE